MSAADDTSAVERVLVSTNTVWEQIAGYSRAVRVGNHVWVSGTTATGPDGEVVGVGDPGAQARFILDKIAAALAQAGAALTDVVRTRIYLRDIDMWEPVSRVHGEVFGSVLPANTLVQAVLVGTQYLVEIEADAFIA